jgi:WS/DGAT/MGAT family acyltransferase
MQALSNLDASFLHLENGDTPMHVGGILCFAPPADGAMSPERFRAHVAARLQTARVFRQRLFMPPAWLDAPVWVEDPAFCLDHHLHYYCVDDLAQETLEALASRFFSTALHRDRPLWEIGFVHTDRGEDGFALLLKVHHSALDGVSAETVILGLLDFSPVPRTLPPDTWTPERLPRIAGLVRQRVNALRHARTEARELLADAAGIGRKLLRRTLSGRDAGLPHYFAAPHTPFNRPVTAARSYHSVELPLQRIKDIKNSQPGHTVNDVVLAVCAGALRRYLQDDGELPAAALVAMTPVSRRGRDEKDPAPAGNKVMSMLVGLATHLADPVERLHRIHHNAWRAKDYSRDITVDALLDQLPVAAPALALEAYSRLHLGRMAPPIFNTVITNVPSSPIPLYFDGAELRRLSGMVCLYDGVALTFVVMSYLGRVSIGITATEDSLRQPQRLMQYLEDALEELAAAVLPAVSAPAGERQALPA